MAAASRLGIEVVVGSEHRPALAGLMEGRHLRLDFHDIERSTGRIVDFSKAKPLAAVVPVHDAGTLLAASAAAALGIAHNPLDAVEAARDKARMRERFLAAGLPTPRFTVMSIDADPAPVAPTLRYPSVVKPLDLSGSQGVIRADSATVFPSVFRRVAAIIAGCSPNGGGRAPRLVEVFRGGGGAGQRPLRRGGRPGGGRLSRSRSPHPSPLPVSRIFSYSPRFSR